MTGKCQNAAIKAYDIKIQVSTLIQKTSAKA